MTEKDFSFNLKSSLPDYCLSLSIDSRSLDRLSCFYNKLVDFLQNDLGCYDYRLSVMKEIFPNEKE